MLLELCKSAVHIMFSDMCPLETGRAREKVGRGQRREATPGRTGRLEERGQWTSCGPGHLHHSEQGGVIPGAPFFSCPSPFFRLSLFPSPDHASPCWLPVFNISFCEMGVAPNSWLLLRAWLGIERGPERSGLSSDFQPSTRTCCSSGGYSGLFLLSMILRP